MRLSRALPALRSRRTMDIITRLLLLSLCGLSASEPLGRLIQRRRDAVETYAREYTREYEPYMYAAIPLHAPVPVLRVLSRAPLQPVAAPSALTRFYTHPTLQYSDPARQYAAPATQYADHTGQYEKPARPYADPARQYENTARLYVDPVRQYENPSDQTKQYARQYADPGRQYADSARQYATHTRQYREHPTRSYAKPARPYAAAEQDYEASSSFDYTREYAQPTRFQKPQQEAPPAYEYAAEYGTYAPQYRPVPLEESPLPRVRYALAPAPYEAGPQEAVVPAVLYARPSPSGGFTYRRVPSEPAPPKSKPPAPRKEKDPQYILKIHKYRIVKDNLI